ncbi:hypothetical protein G8T76_10695 [Clostridium botulinum C/D]|uniref:hypothetical protein n=1 Tax=Clostridium botulinum TaxID=1491 RepID=UPI000313DC01|nr:hypothetical protein [Clostridium botulinum]KEI02889.1 hypothetical protein Y848_06380 [Clostridium botulinum C/D str. Sp77]KOA76861.1 hypothetical protein ADU78_05225 [Clostridium botulinum]KOA80940.1 hypothetical protein ADU77_00150 [Clostridium botulinum]KOA88966.1 hypothetical protein ADU75_00880 [Clostridium botulinum]KOC31835.1 hypothetical protein ADU83_11950 [Clostridium botulinum]
MNRDEELKQEIKEKWFKDHKAKLIDCGNIKILEWKKPGTIYCYTRYVFDGNKIYITGDLGEAIFNLTWNADIHSFNDINTSYFHEKLAAFSDSKYDFDSDEAVKSLKEWKEELLQDRVFENEYEKIEFMDNISALILAADSCSSEDEWAYEYVNGEYNDFISHEDCDYWEWIYDIGRVIPSRIYGYLIGLQMASEQLKDSQK